VQKSLCYIHRCQELEKGWSFNKLITAFISLAWMVL
jgi:hypothetical protein